MSAPTIVLDSVVFEIRYAFGYYFLDRCGQIMLDIERELEGWINNGIEGAVAKFENPFHQFTATINIEKFVFMSDHPDKQHPEQTTKSAKDLWKIIQGNLSVNEFHRVGLRLKYLAAHPKLEDAEAKTASIQLGINAFNEIIKGGFKPTQRQVFQVLEYEDTQYRVGIQPLTRSQAVDPRNIINKPSKLLPRHQREAREEQNRRLAEYSANPKYCVEFDIDCAQLDPNEIHVSSYITKQTEVVNSYFLPVFESIL